MFLMNLGGIGIMAVGTLLWILLGRKIGVKERRQIIADNAQYKMSGAVKLVQDIITLLIAVEVAGALYIYLFLYRDREFIACHLARNITSVSLTTVLIYTVITDSSRRQYFY